MLSFIQQGVASGQEAPRTASGVERWRIVRDIDELSGLESGRVGTGKTSRKESLQGLSSHKDNMATGGCWAKVGVLIA